MPVPPTSRYFHVASKARGVLLKCSSGTEHNVKASVAIHSTPRCRAMWAALIRPSAARKLTTNTRFGRSARNRRYGTP